MHHEDKKEGQISFERLAEANGYRHRLEVILGNPAANFEGERLSLGIEPLFRLITEIIVDSGDSDMTIDWVEKTVQQIVYHYWTALHPDARSPLEENELHENGVRDGTRISNEIIRAMLKRFAKAKLNRGGKCGAIPQISNVVHGATCNALEHVKK
jgi:hypothetical protein